MAKGKPQDSIIRMAAEVGSKTALDVYAKQKDKEKRKRVDLRLRNTKRLMRSYREIKVHVGDAIASLSEVEKEDYLTELQRKQLKILKHYGSHKQLNQLVEECAELIVAIQKQQRYDSSTISDTISDTISGSVIEEMADVKNLIEQLELYRHYVARGVKITIENKTDRELERIKEEKARW